MANRLNNTNLAAVMKPVATSCITIPTAALSSSYQSQGRILTFQQFLSLNASASPFLLQMYVTPLNNTLYTVYYSSSDMLLHIV